VENRPRMRIESDYGWHGSDCICSLYNRTHDQLMAQMQSVKDSESQHRGPENFGIVSSMKESHTDLQFPTFKKHCHFCRTRSTESTYDQPVVGKLDPGWQSFRITTMFNVMSNMGEIGAPRLYLINIFQSLVNPEMCWMFLET